jgi:hypothetical protein
MSYLRYLCLFAHRCVQDILRCVFVLSCVSYVDCPFVLFLLAIVLSVLPRYTDSDYPFGIFNLLLPVSLDCLFLVAPSEFLHNVVIPQGYVLTILFRSFPHKDS